MKSKIIVIFILIIILAALGWLIYFYFIGLSSINPSIDVSSYTNSNNQSIIDVNKLTPEEKINIMDQLSKPLPNKVRN